MSATLPVHVFRDPHFAPAGDTWVCIADQLAMARFLTKQEVSDAFSGCATYVRSEGSWFWPLPARARAYVGVWGRKNGQRFRRFLWERGAILAVQRRAPPDLRLVVTTTEAQRRKVRDLPDSSARSALKHLLERVVAGGDVTIEELDQVWPDLTTLPRQEKEAWEELSHWADDDDIRARDPGYAGHKRERMASCLLALSRKV